MINLYLLLMFNCLFIMGFKFVTWYEPSIEQPTENKTTATENFKIIPTVYNRELLWWISFYGKKYLGHEFMKPVCLCPMCMSSLWGSIFFWVAIFSKFIVCVTFVHLIVIWLVYIVALCGLNHIISRFV